VVTCWSWSTYLLYIGLILYLFVIRFWPAAGKASPCVASQQEGLGRLPSVGGYNKYQPLGWVITVNGDGGCSGLQVDSQPKSVGLRIFGRLALSPHSLHELSELWQRLYHYQPAFIHCDVVETVIQRRCQSGRTVGPAMWTDATITGPTYVKYCLSVIWSYYFVILDCFFLDDIDQLRQFCPLCSSLERVSSSLCCRVI